MRISDWSSDVCSSDLWWPGAAAAPPRRPRACSRPDRSRSRVESLRRPALRRARVDQAVVQTESAVLPELDEPRGQAEARPVRRPRHLADGVLGGEQRHPPLQLEAALQRPRLLAGPGADLALTRPAVDVGVGCPGAHRPPPPPATYP